MSTAMSASSCCTSWWPAIGLPNWLALARVADGRVQAALGDADAAGRDRHPALGQRGHGDPEALALGAEHARRRAPGRPRGPAPRWPGRAGRACRGSPWRVSPGASVGTRKAVTPRGPGPPVRAKTSATSAQVPLVMNILVPLSTQSSPSRTARVVSVAGVGAGARLGEARSSRAPRRRTAAAATRALLRVGAVRGDRLGDQAERDRDDAAHRRVAPAELLDAPGSTRGGRRRSRRQLLGDGQAEEAELAELLDDRAVDALARGPTRPRAG